jgi:uncharacterized protein YaeQ
MALPSILYDFQVELHHVDRGLEQQLHVKAARHPSETLERLWLRALAFCWCWEDRLSFGAGLSEPDSPDLLATDYAGNVTHWVRVGKMDVEKAQRILDRNSGAKVTLVFEAPRRMAEFVDDARAGGLTRASRLELAAVDPGLLRSLASDESRRAKLSLTIVGDHLYVDRGGETLDGPLERTRLEP